MTELEEEVIEDLHAKGMMEFSGFVQSLLLTNKFCICEFSQGNRLMLLEVLPIFPNLKDEIRAKRETFLTKSLRLPERALDQEQCIS
jgi:hypothetical protein